MLQLAGGAGLEIAKGCRERIKKTHTGNGGAMSGTYTLTLTGTYPLDQSLVLLLGQGPDGVYTTGYVRFGFYLSGPQTVSIPYSCNDTNYSHYLLAEAVKLKNRPQSIEVVAGGSAVVTLSKTLTDYSQAIMIPTAMSAHDGWGGLGIYAKITGANQVSFFQGDDTTAATPDSTWRGYVIQP